MRILHVISTLAPTSGGTTEVVRGLSAAQAAQGDEVTICTTNRGNPVREILPEGNCDLRKRFGITLRRFPVSCVPVMWSAQMRRYLLSAARTFDLIHIHGLYRFPQTYAAFLARRQRLAYVIQLHGTLDPYLYAKSTAGSVVLKRLYERWFDMPNLHGAGALLYTAEGERKKAEFLGLRAPAVVVPNGIDWSRYEELPARGALRQRWALPDASVVLFIGRLHSVKGLDLLVAAFDKLRSRLPEARLVIAGPENDAYGGKVRGWVRERGMDDWVRFVGPLYGKDLLQAYVDADVLSLPSYTENFGMAVAEAMACKLPVVISDQVNIHDAVARAGAGLVTRCDASEIAAALETLLRDRERRRAMGEAGRRLVREEYTWPAVAAALREEYHRVIERQNCGATAARPRV